MECYSYKWVKHDIIGLGVYILAYFSISFFFYFFYNETNKVLIQFLLFLSILNTFWIANPVFCWKLERSCQIQATYRSRKYCSSIYTSKILLSSIWPFLGQEKQVLEQKKKRKKKKRLAFFVCLFVCFYLSHFGCSKSYLLKQRIAKDTKTKRAVCMLHLECK